MVKWYVCENLYDLVESCWYSQYVITTPKRQFFFFFFSWVKMRYHHVMVVMGRLCLAGEPVQEGLVGEHAVLIFGVSQLSQKGHGVFLGDLISQVGEDVLELSQHHGAVLVLVVELAELDVVVVGAGALWGLDGVVDESDDVVEGGELLALLLLLAKADADLLGHVEAGGVDNVHQVEHVQLAFAIPVVDVADLLNSVSISHFECVVLSSCL